MSGPVSPHVDAILVEVLARPAAERGGYLDLICREDAALRADIEELLAVHDEAGTFLEHPAVTMETAVGERLAEGAGTVIGRYKLLQLIGEGGFGAVYMAEQRVPVKRTVALKIIKLGMDTRQVIARFEAERQALAMMDHPNIAKVLDAGATDSGRPYFVMELVKGIPINEYCDKNNLDTLERLGLFVHVCRAVQHAHQKGVIHRDLKPSNVMITLHDGRPVPKVIDFGIAKATNRELTDKTLFTEYRQFIGTPEYMSPEQAEMSGLDIDTRSDIYSLGVLLYELLTGTTPFDSRALREAGYGEIQRIIREDEPHKPSTRVSTMGDEVTDVAKHRHTDAVALNRQLRGDLDWIVMKSMEKDRTRRYDTANELAMDIRRYLDCEPVLATPPSPGYRVRKFVRRNRIAVTAGSLVTAALVLGITAAMVGFVQAERQRARFEHEAARAASVSGFLGDMLAAVDPAVSGGREVTVRSMLDAASEKIEAGELTEQPRTEASLHCTLATTYSSLGFEKSARPHLERALELCRREYGDDDLRTAGVMHDLGNLYGSSDPKAASLLQTVLEVRRRELGDEHPDTLETMYLVAWSRYYMQGEADGEALHRETLARRCRALGEEHPQTAKSWNCVGVVCERTGRPDEAISMYGRALEIGRRANGEYHPATLTYINNLARVYKSQGHFEKAKELLTAAVPVDRMGAQHPRTLAILEQLIEITHHQGRLDEARAWASRLFDAERENARLSGNDPETLNGLAWLLLTIEPADLRDPEEALRTAMLANAISGESDPDILDTLALAYHLTGDTARAVEIERTAVNLLPPGSAERVELEERLHEFEEALDEAAADRG